MKWLKKVGARVAQALIDKFEPKIQSMSDPIVRVVLIFVLKWVKKVFEVLTDADPNDEEQIKAIAQEFLDDMPKEGLEFAKIILLSKLKKEEDKELIANIINDIIEDVAA